MRNNLDSSRSALWLKINDVLGLFETQCLAAGSILGWFFGWFYKGYLIVAPAYLAAVIEGFGELFITNLQFIGAVFGAFTLFVFGKILTSWLYHNSPTTEEVMKERDNRLFVYKLPNWPTSNKLQFVVGESHNDDGGYIPDPQWKTIPQQGLYGNIFVAGGIGTGKTTACAYPFIEQVLQYRPDDDELKPCGLILDEKGDFIKTVMEFARSVNRQDDIISIEIDGEFTWNPIHAPDIMVEVLAGRLLALYENMKGGEGNSGGQWVQDGMFKILKHGIGIHRIGYGYISIRDINTLVADMSGEASEYQNPVIDTLNRYDAVVMNRKAKGEITEDEEADYQYHREFFEKELAAENTQNKATYIGAVTTITDLFSKPSIAKTFCPAEDEITLPGFKSLVDSGKIVVLNAPSAIYGSIGTALGIMLKLEFQRTLLGRVARESKDVTLNKNRPAFFLCDEYQNFVTVSGKSTNEGDDKFYAESRQGRCVSMVLTQSITSLVAKTGKEKASVILGSLRTKIFFAITLEEDQKRAAELCGKSLQSAKTESYSENIKDGGYNPLSGDMSGKGSGMSSNVSYQERQMHNVEPTEFGGLKSFESVSIIFNGIRLESPKRIYHKTNFLPEKFSGKHTKRTIPYKILIDELTRELYEEDLP